MSDVKSATRRIPKATYVPLKLDTPLPATGASIMKFGYIRNLALQPGEVAAARKQLTAPVGRQKQASLPGAGSALWNILKVFEGSPMPSQLPSPSVLAKVPSPTLLSFGKAVLGVRQQKLNQLQNAPTAAPSAAVAKPTAVPLALDLANNLGGALAALNGAVIANKSFEANVAATPIGMLNLERLEMTPTSLERGELLATIPLAPKEQTSVQQKEWSNTTKEFSSIVTDSLENYSENGVTENTELAQSTNSQVQHSSQFNINATVSGGIGFVSGSVSTAFATQDSSSASAAVSRNHALGTTRKASSRVKQEHKISISTTTVIGNSQTTTRTLQNPSDSNPMRIDYFSLMRKWRVALYRYGLRLTYDIAIPEPGASLREVYMQLDIMQKQAAQGFQFSLTPNQITAASLPGLIKQWPAPVSALPPNTITLSIPYTMDNVQDTIHMHYESVPFDLDPRYMVDPASTQTVDYVYDGQQMQRDINNTEMKCLEDELTAQAAFNKLSPNSAQQSYTSKLTGLTGQQGHLQATYRHAGMAAAVMHLNIVGALTPQALADWQNQAWNALFNAAQTGFYAQQNVLNTQIQSLQDKINSVDTLTLRREENDEIMKGVLRWLLGPSFDFMPQQVVDLFSENLQYGVNFTGNDLVRNLAIPVGPGGVVEIPVPFTPGDWTTMFQYQEMVKFINEAIEWENVIYFLYSYFWDVPESWDFIRQIQHQDATRQAFLRSGSSRVVLTVRKGWETAWVSFVETGGFGQTLLPGHPYMSIAQEIQAYDDTNYPGIPPANPASDPTLNQNSVATTSSAKVAASGGAVTIPVASSTGFAVGASVVIDAYVYSPNDPSKNPQETQVVTAVPPDGTHITVQMLSKSHDGSTAPFSIIQPAEQGMLIAEWFEYTPTSGTDIAVTSNLSTIA
jgi:hypothetical protein